MEWNLIAAKDVSLYGYVAEFSYAIEALHIAGRADVDAPAVVEQLVATDENVAHEVVAIEASPGIAIGEVIKDADVPRTLYADAVVAAVLHDVALDDLSLALRHWCTSVHAVAEARLVFYEDTVVATAHTDAVRDDEVLVLIASQPNAYAAAAALAFRPVAPALYHAHIVYQYTIEEVNAQSCCGSAPQDEVVENSICQGAYVEGFAVGDVGGGLHFVGIDREVFEAHTFDGREVALLGALADEKRPVGGANHLEHGALHRDTLQADL